MKNRRGRRRGEETPAAESRAERVAQAFELPAGIFSGMPHITMLGNREIFIDGHKGLVQYDENMVKLAAGPLIITITGRGFDIKSLAAEAVLISGYITGMSFDN